MHYKDVGAEGVRNSITGKVPDWQLEGLLELIALQGKGHATKESDDLAKLIGKPSRLDHWIKAHAKHFTHPDLPEEK